jgi:pyruvate,water dikinase
MREKYIFDLADPQARLETTGGKGASLARLAQAGLPVPGGFHILTSAYRKFIHTNQLQPQILAALAGVNTGQPATLETAARQIETLFARAPIPDEIAEAIAQAYNALTQPATRVAVRSSATAEDLPDLSFAGQQDTYLNIQGQDAVLEAVKRCWASLWTARAIGYRIRNNIDQSAVSLAVIVQILVPADVAGILFTANPLNGRRDQMVINASWGLGEAIVSGQVTPDTLTVAKSSGMVIERQTAQKLVMTARVEGATETRPVPEALQRAPVLSDAEASALVKMGMEIEQLYGTPMDIEWAMQEGKIYILQARPVTTLEQTPAAPVEEFHWRGPKPSARYMRNNIVELMPDPLTPLFATLGRRVINQELKRAMADFLPDTDFLPEELIITINGYAYYNGDFNMRKIGSMLVNSVKIMRRMLSGMEERWQAARPRCDETVTVWKSQPLRQLPAEKILNGTEELMQVTVNYYAAIVSGLIPAAWMSEGLFSLFYNTLIRRKEDPRAAVFLLGFENTPLKGEKSLFDLAQWARSRADLAAFLSSHSAKQIHSRLGSGEGPEQVSEENWNEWKQRWHFHLDQYGAAIYDLDFATATPADDPTPLLETLKLFLNGQGPNPYERQEAAAKQREQAVSAVRQRKRGKLLTAFNKRLEQAQHLAPLREDGLAEIGQGYPQLRRMLLEIGRRLVQAKAIGQDADVFWLEEAELSRASRSLDRNEPVGSLMKAIRERKAAWQAQKQLIPPLMLPQMPRLSLRKKQIDQKGRAAGGEFIRGVACSPGRVTGRARVLRGTEDFALMQPGEVLVAAITTPAWTPLFVMASAIVTDVGGPLSHGSIVAREYGVPAVLGTGEATRRIHTGDRVTVDGTQGKVYIEPPGDSSMSVWALKNPKDQFMRASICELMPNPLSPLFGSIGMQAITRGIGIMSDKLLKMPIDTFGDFMQAINGYAYEKVSFTGRQWWYMLSRMVPAMLRILREGIGYWQNTAHPYYTEVVARWQAKSTGELSAEELYTGVQEVLDAFGHHLGALMASTMGPAAGSEGLFTQLYEKKIRRPDDPPALTFLMGFENHSLAGEKSLYDLALWCRDHPEMAAYLTGTPPERLAVEWNAQAAPPDVPSETWGAWRSRFADYLDRFGYGIYDMDFASPLPGDNPAPILETLVLFVRGQGKNPYERQSVLARQREAAVEATRQRLRGLKRWAFEKTLGWAQTRAPLREDGLMEIGLGYPVLRRMLHELGSRFVAAGAIDQPEDIYWLEQGEVEQHVEALTKGRAMPGLHTKIAERKALWQAQKRLTPPPQLPPKSKYLGMDADKILASRGEQKESGVIRGTPCSPGCVTGTARVLHGPEDFDQMQPGDILVAGITTPAWTPLFALASAVVTDIGGPLSHGSIVAREYGIPAVLGTGVATRQIASGQTITVDGAQGTIHLHTNGNTLHPA